MEDRTVASATSDTDRFRVEARRYFGPFCGVRVFDTVTGRPIPLARGGMLLIGMGSVNRAAKYGIQRYLRHHAG
jgi:hypothetical protein